MVTNLGYKFCINYYGVNILVEDSVDSCIFRLFICYNCNHCLSIRIEGIIFETLVGEQIPRIENLLFATFMLFSSLNLMFSLDLGLIFRKMGLPCQYFHFLVVMPKMDIWLLVEMVSSGSAL